MRYLALIQARCGSSRLPNKVMMQVGGKPVLEWVISRVRMSKKLDELMVVTSIEKNNLPLIKLCAEKNTRVYVGSENDVLDRYYQAAKLLKPDYVIRITADCPVFDYRYLDDAIEQLRPETDYMYDCDETFPDGLDIEIIKFSALKESWEKSRMLLEREHVTLYIKNHKTDFVIQNLKCPIDGIGYHRWTLDEEVDYELIQLFYDYFISNGKLYFNTDDILKLLSVKPELCKINNHILRNEGYLKQIPNDKIVELESLKGKSNYD